jgi:hypothetical protein
MDQIGWIRRLHGREHKSEREISRNTVAKWLHGELAEPKYRRAGRPNKLAPYCEALQQALAADARRAKHERRTAKALYAGIGVTGIGVTQAQALGSRHWGQVLPFAPSRNNLLPCPAPCASNSPARFTTSPRAVIGASRSTKKR